jgi:hypothetical protein
MTDGEQLPGGPSRTCVDIKVHDANRGKTILWAEKFHPRVSNDTPNWCAFTAIAPTVRFSVFEMWATPAFFLAIDFSSRTSDAVHARRMVFFFAEFFFTGKFFTEFFFLAIVGSLISEPGFYHA